MEKNTLKVRVMLGEIIFLIHLPIVCIWAGLFLIPLQVWGMRVVFHFYFILFMLASQIAGGALFWPVSGRFDLVCPLTVLMQWVRGYNITDSRTYRHSFVVELFNRLRIPVYKKVITLLIIISVVAVVFQYREAVLK